MAAGATTKGLRWNWVTRVIRRYDPEKRPRLTAWIITAIVAVIALFGFLGFAIPTAISWWLKRGS